MGKTGELTRRDEDYRPFETLGRVDGANGDFLKRCEDQTVTTSQWVVLGLALSKDKQFTGDLSFFESWESDTSAMWSR